ncbi:MAG: hypothetical protein IJA34_00120 [Lachnospiraceae bacterium]|nr:hypothetical protein [Lachnospiraceae bacterium]
MSRNFKITSPYSDVVNLFGKDEYHYKTNLHTHSTYSDANNTMADMIAGFYDNDFDILAFAEHGLLGKEWDKLPTLVPLFTFQYLWHGKRRHLTTEEYRQVLSGTYKTKNNLRTKKRGLMCIPRAIEANMFTLMKNHVNGYFTDNALEGKYGKENDFEGPIKRIEQSGGVSHINHPTDWLGAYRDPSCAKVPENIRFFADLIRRYKSCLGIEVLNMYDRPNRSDRILWDELLKKIIPEGKRTVFGFANSDAHRVCEIDTAFMDFIIPEYSMENFRNALENGRFFSIARYAKNELGEDFVGEGPYPFVNGMVIDDENDIIKISGVNCSVIEWIADGEIIKSDKIDTDGELTSEIRLTDYEENISCYVRAQLKGRGGICMTQAFVCDDGNMERFIDPDAEIPPLTDEEKKKKAFDDTRLGVIVNKIKQK